MIKQKITNHLKILENRLGKDQKLLLKIIRKNSKNKDLQLLMVKISKKLQIMMIKIKTKNIRNKNLLM